MRLFMHGTRDHTSVKRCAVNLFALCLCLLIAGLTRADPPTVPQPFLCMYGHSDNAGVTDAFRKFIPPFNVIEGTSSDAGFIKELRASGRLYAAHVNNSASATSNDLLTAWRAPFDNTLGGQLPGGFDAIAIDELLSASTDGTTQSDNVVWALQQLRALYPGKRIFVAAVWQYAQSAGSYSDQLNAVNNYTDMLMLEKYMPERNLSYWSATYADNLKATVPGILSKTVFGLYIAQHGFVADDKSNVGYWGMLDEQFHRIKNDADASIMPGLMFWAYYRSETELTPAYCARLFDHYYIQGNTSYFGDGSTAQLISNPGFEGSTSGWLLTPGAGGSVAQFNISSEGIRDDHSADPIRNMGQGPSYVTHNSSGLKMVRGSTYNKASYQVAVNTSMTYTVSAWVLANLDNSKAKVTITESDDTPIASEEILHAGTYDYARIAFNFVPPSSPIKIVLNDEPTTSGRTLYWDFIELEDAYLTDRDVDGMADDWEMSHFGSTASSSGGADADYDHDGFRDLYEFLACTDPTNSDSLLAISSVRRESASDSIITWYSVTNKTYSIRSSTNLFEPWSPLVSNIIGAPPLNVHTVTAENTPVYYRIELE